MFQMLRLTAKPFETEQLSSLFDEYWGSSLNSQYILSADSHDRRAWTEANMIRRFQGHAPQIAASAYVDPQAVVIGNVAVGEDSSIWPCAVLRGDYLIPQARLAVDLGAPHAIRIGARTSIQDGCVIHIQGDEYSASVGDNVTVGHGVILHGCTVESSCLIGMGAILLNGSKIGTGSIVAAGTLIPEGMVVPPGSLAMGVPGKVRRAVTEAERAGIAVSAEHYVGFKNAFKAENYR